MSAVAVTSRRTLSRLRNLLPTSFSIAGFLAASAGALSLSLAEAEGSHQLLSVLWASSVGPILPVLAALLGMDVWSDERRAGRIELLLSTAVRERDFVFGKTLGVFTAVTLSILLSLAVTFSLFAWLSPSVLTGLRLSMFFPALFILLLQGALWSAIAVAISAFFRQAFVSASMTVLLLVGLPRGLWFGAQLYSALGRPAFGEMPLDAHVVDFSSGVFSSGVILGYIACTVTAILVATKVITLIRFPGRRASFFRFSSLLTILLAFVCTVGVIRLGSRLDFTLDLPIGSDSTLSPLMRHILSESSGHVTVTAFVPRKDPSFRPLAHFLRTIKRQSDSLGSLEMTLRFVDPQWDLGASDRIVRLGAHESSVVFEKGHRVSILPLSDGFGDGLIASALRRVTLPPQRQDIYWTTGHGEASVEAYDMRGLSDIARELARNGFRNRSIDLSGTQPIPSDCALIVIAGAKDAFSFAELNRLDTYLRGGGRLLVLMGPSAEAGPAALLPPWGVRPLLRPIVGARTLSGSDVIVSDLRPHPVTSGLSGSRLVFERPVSFEPSAAIESALGADHLEFISVARVNASTLVAVVERGSGLGSDLAVRPMRLVVVGDASFVHNGQLAVRANANRDFFMNVISYLSGSEVTGLSGSTGIVLSSGMDRALRTRHALYSVVIVPGAVLLMMAFVAWRRRRRA